MKKFFVLATLIFLPTQFLWAVQMTNLYEASIPIAQQSETVKNEAIKTGLIEVLTALTGNSEVQQNAIIQGSLSRAKNYVQEFSYAPDPNGASPYLIHISYNVQDVNRLLRRSGIPYWNGNRPLIMVWLTVTRNAQETTIVSNEMSNEVLPKVQASAKKFGLPIIFPILDMAELSQLNAEAIKSFSIDPIKQASKRYTPDAYLMGNLVQNNDLWESQWQLVLGDQVWNWTFTDKTPVAITTSLLKATSQSLAKFYMIQQRAEANSSVQLEVNNITKPKDLKRLLAFLRKLPQVQSAELAGINGEVVQIALSVRGSMNNFQQSATLGEHLTLRAAAEGDNNKLMYEWNP